MEKITSAAWREFSFPSPVDVHGHRSDKQNKNENDERQQALQNAKLYTRLPARESFRSISRKFWTAQASRGHVTFTAGVRLIWRRRATNVEKVVDD